MSKYDVIIIGAGPNGLTTGAYLSKAGLKTLLLEKKTEAGGGLATEEVTIPGFLHNTHSIYHMMVEYAPLYKDLNLEQKYNVKYIYPSLQFVLPLANGKALCFYNDVNKTCDSIAKISRKDADTYREVSLKYKRYMDEFLAPATYAPPLSALDQAAKLEQSDIGREITELSEKSPQKIIFDLFENESVRLALLYMTCHWGLEHDLEGVGFLAALYFNRSTNYRLCTGGSHMLSQALTKVIIENGGMIWGSQRIKRIIVKDGTAKGVELEDGRTIEANKAVVSSLDPIQTFKNLIDNKSLSKDFLGMIDDWKWEKWSLFEAHLAMEQAPDFKISSSDPQLNKALIYILGYESTADLLNHWKAIEKGEITGLNGFHCSFPSVHDPSQAPPGKCTGLISQMAPYQLKEGSDKWYSLKFKEEHTERCLSTLRKYAPNINKDAILWMNYSTPIDIENKFSDMVRGSIKQGAYTPFQLGYLRPNQDCSQNRTPIKNLYVCGASTHPGGLIILGAGYLAANTIASDLGINKWWHETEMVSKARQRGLL